MLFYAEIIIDRTGLSAWDQGIHNQQDAVDLILRKYPDFARVYENYQGLQSALKQRNVDELNSAIFAYENTKTAMDQTFTPPIISPTVPNTTIPTGY